MDKFLCEEILMDEGVKESVASLALAAAMVVPGFVSNSKASEIIHSANSIEQIQNGYLNATSSISSNDRLGYDAGKIINIVSRTLFAEAQGEGEQGIRAVASVIWNRAKHNPKNLTTVCFSPKQFSCWNGAKPLTNPAYKPNVYQLKFPAEIKDSVKMLKIWMACVSIAREMVEGEFSCSKGLENANQYARTNLIPKLNWNMTNTVKIGHHTFGTVPTRFYFYEVKNGETFESIAKKLFPESTYSDFNYFLQDIKKLNPAITLKAGIQIKIPKKI